LAASGFCCETAGEVDEALQLLDRELEEATAARERSIEAELLGSRASGCSLAAPHAARRRKTVWRDQGKRSESARLAGIDLRLVTEGVDTPVLKEAKALLDELR
jgi:hypothetical protein